MKLILIKCKLIQFFLFFHYVAHEANVVVKGVYEAKKTGVDEAILNTTKWKQNNPKFRELGGVVHIVSLSIPSSFSFSVNIY